MKLSFTLQFFVTFFFLLFCVPIFSMEKQKEICDPTLECLKKESKKYSDKRIKEIIELEKKLKKIREMALCEVLKIKKLKKIKKREDEKIFTLKITKKSLDFSPLDSSGQEE